MKKVMAVLLTGALVFGMTGGVSAASFSKDMSKRTYLPGKFERSPKKPFKIMMADRKYLPTHQERAKAKMIDILKRNQPSKGIPVPKDPKKRAR